MRQVADKRGNGFSARSFAQLVNLHARQLG
jgi:hypothetical protein